MRKNFENSHVALIYIATGKYIEYFKEFYSTCHRFLPQAKKSIIVLTDEFEEDLINECQNLGDSDIYVKYLRHYPWPINALFKMHYIKEVLDNSNMHFDYVFYFNANSWFKKIYEGEDFSLDKINLVHHYAWEWNPSVEHYFKAEDDNPKSTSYIGHQNYEYLQSGFFGGSYDSMMDLCTEVMKMCNEDLSNNIIPKWHDETYLNKYALVNPDKINVLPYGFMFFYEYDDKFKYDNVIELQDSRRTEKLKDNKILGG